MIKKSNNKSNNKSDRRVNKSHSFSGIDSFNALGDRAKKFVKDVNERARPKKGAKVKRTKIAILPLLGFEVAVATVLDKKKFEIIPLDITEKNLTEDYGQELFGEWCYPLKLTVAMIEKAIVKDHVKKFIGYNINICRYPLVMGDMTKWVKKDFEYYPVMFKEIGWSTDSCIDIFRELKKAIPGFSFMEATKKAPIALKRSLLAGELTNFYFKHLPLVSNPLFVKQDFKKTTREFILAEGVEESEKVAKAFMERVEKQVVRKKPKFKFLLSGDVSVIVLDFPIFDLDVFLAKNEIELVRPGFPPTVYHLRYANNGKKAKEIISKVLSHKTHKTEVSQHHVIESSTIYQILEGIDRGVDGIIFIKPNMCAPCENVSYILKEVKSFGLPIVEITYDEHQGVNGIITRLEAFINIVSETKNRKMACSQNKSS
ncbi:MAG: 2-hydroxyacyl-CoA dehydratase family protein [Nanoarchaeota archaeon]|nr:2-hydroxyacyl-CoA dehydratase family protein [Nanoarchaeota archaeon]